MIGGQLRYFLNKKIYNVGNVVRLLNNAITILILRIK